MDLLSQGVSLRAAGKQMGVSYETVRKLAASAQEKGKSFEESVIKPRAAEALERLRERSKLTRPEDLMSRADEAGRKPTQKRSPEEQALLDAGSDFLREHGVDPSEFGVAGIPGLPGALPGAGRPLALANERVAAERAARGEEPVPKSFHVSHPEAAAMAEEALRANPRAAEQLVDELEARKRPTSIAENALLLYQMVHLKGELRRVNAKASVLNRTPEDAVRSQRQANDLLRQMGRLESVAEATGGEAGGAFNFRKQLIAEDYSLEGMMQKAFAAKGGDLTEAETAKVKELSDRIEELQKRLDKQQPGDRARGIADARIDLGRARRDFTSYTRRLADSQLSLPQKVFRGGLESLNAARALMTSMDLSAVMRQGGFLAFGHPVKALGAFPDMFRAFASERAADRAADALAQRPNAGLYKKAGLYLSNPHAGPSAQEEAYVGRFVKNIPGVAGSERAYTTFLNRIRTDVFDSMTASLGTGGRVNEAEAKVIANFVNVATGRGGLGFLEKAATPMAQLFFSPRFVASRFQLLAGQPLMGGAVNTRLQVASEYARTLAGLGVFYAVMKMANDDATVEFDPRSADFGKVKVGNTRIDPMMGLAQEAVFLTRMGTGKTKSTTTGKVNDLRGDNVPYGGQKVMDVAGRFVRSKLAPVPGAITDVVTGENVIGDKTNPAQVASNLGTPLAMRDVYEALQDQGLPRGAAVGLMAILGMGIQVYQKRQERPQRR